MSDIQKFKNITRHHIHKSNDDFEVDAIDDTTQLICDSPFQYNSINSSTSGAKANNTPVNRNRFNNDNRKGILDEPNSNPKSCESKGNSGLNQQLIQIVDAIETSQRIQRNKQYALAKRKHIAGKRDINNSNVSNVPTHHHATTGSAQQSSPNMNTRSVPCADATPTYVRRGEPHCEDSEVKQRIERNRQQALAKKRKFLTIKDSDNNSTPKHTSATAPTTPTITRQPTTTLNSIFHCETNYPRLSKTDVKQRIQSNKLEALAKRRRLSISNDCAAAPHPSGGVMRGVANVPRIPTCSDKRGSHSHTTTTVNSPLRPLPAYNTKLTREEQVERTRLSRLAALKRKMTSRSHYCQEDTKHVHHVN